MRPLHAGAPFERTAASHGRRERNARPRGARRQAPYFSNCAGGRPGDRFSAKTEKAPRGGLLLPRVPIGCIVVCKVLKYRLPDCFRGHIGIVVCIEAMSKGMTV